MTDTEVDDRIGNLLAGRFRLEKLLGRGGMATVYLADDESLGRAVAIKVFRRDLADGDDLQRQQDEMQLLATLNHPSLVTLFDAATDELGNAFLVMELVEGTDLHSRLRDGPLPATEVATIGQHLADALAYVHARGVIHRDIKPGNILLPHPAEEAGPQAKLADFGIARVVDGSRLTATGTVLGTATYFSPEQALGEPLTPASDLYSLGLVLLECLTGERAFPGTALESMMARISRDPDVPATLGDSWVGVLRGMTTRAPDARPTARDVSGALARLANSTGATARYPTVTEATQAYSPTGLTAAGQAQARADDPAAAQPEGRVATEDHTMNSAAPAHPGWSLRGRRVLLLAGTLVVVALLSWAATIFAPTMMPEAEPVAPVEYPVVDGPLGTHLEQLQRSVEP